MRLAPNDAAPERGLLTKEELLQTPPLPAGSGFDHATGPAVDGVPLRRELNGLWCSGRCARRCPGRRFPDFGTGGALKARFHGIGEVLDEFMGFKWFRMVTPGVWETLSAPASS